MNKRVLGHALGGACLLGLSVPVAAANKNNEIHVSAIPAVADESYLVEFSESEGYIIAGKKGEKLYAQSFSFDLLNKEEIACFAQANTNIEFVPAQQRPDRTDGPRPGWKEFGGGKIKGNNKVKACGFRGKVSSAGTYELTFLSETPGTMRIYFYNASAGMGKDEANSRLASARPVAARDLAALPPRARGSATYLGNMPAGGARWLETKPEKLRPFFAALLRDAEYNAVGNFSKLGVAAMGTGDFAMAEWALDQALNRIEAIYANDDAAKAARSKFSEEAIKDFKGDPYERAMAYYYRGLLYLREGDFGNARASFATAEYQDTVSEAEEYQSDFGLMNYLAGWSARCMGNEALAEDAFAAASSMDATLKAPDVAHRTLVIAEAGVGPVKVRRGKKQAMVGVYHSHDFTAADAPSPTLQDRSDLTLVRAGDISYQATTRGGRQFDAIMNGKVSFKETMGTISDVATVGVALLSDQLGTVGSLFSAFGGLGSGLLSGSTKTNADIRYWDSLPDAVYLGTANGSSATGPVSYSDNTSANASMTSVGGLKCGLSWSSDRHPVDAAAGLPGTPAEAPKWREKKNGAQARDDAFRKDLMAEAI